MKEQEMIAKYIKQLTDNERKAYEIAKENLETSFDISKSIGFLKFKDKITCQDSAHVAYTPAP